VVLPVSLEPVGSITTVQDGNASEAWFGGALARKISVKRESAAAASLESLAAATMKSWITFQRAPRIQPRRRSDEHCRGESRRFPRVGLAASATPMPRRRIRAVVTAEIELQTGTPAFYVEHASWQLVPYYSSVKTADCRSSVCVIFCTSAVGDSTLSGSTLNDVLAVGVQKV